MLEARGTAWGGENRARLAGTGVEGGVKNRKVEVGQKRSGPQGRLRVQQEERRGPQSGPGDTDPGHEATREETRAEGQGGGAWSRGVG